MAPSQLFPEGSALITSLLPILPFNPESTTINATVKVSTIHFYLAFG